MSYGWLFLCRKGYTLFGGWIHGPKTRQTQVCVHVTYVNERLLYFCVLP